MRTNSATFIAAANSQVQDCKAYVRIAKDRLTYYQYQPDEIKSIEIDRSVDGTGSIIVGSASAQTLKLNLYTDRFPNGSTDISEWFITVTAKYGSESVVLGVFNTTEADVVRDGKNIELTARDVLYSLDSSSGCAEFSVARGSAEQVQDMFGDVADCATGYGISMAYPDASIGEKQFYMFRPSSGSVRSQLSQIAAMCGSIVKVTGNLSNDGYVVTTRRFGDNSTVPEFTPSDYPSGGFSISKSDGTCYDSYSCVFDGGQHQGGQKVVSKPDDASHGTIVVDSSLMGYTGFYEEVGEGTYDDDYDYGKAESDIAESASTINGTSISATGFSLKLMGNPYLECGDKIRVKDMQGSWHDLYVTSCSISYDGSFTTTVGASSSSEDATASSSTYNSEVQAAINASADQLCQHFWVDGTGAYVSLIPNSADGRHVKIDSGSFNVCNGDVTNMSVDDDDISFYKDGYADPFASVGIQDVVNPSNPNQSKHQGRVYLREVIETSGSIDSESESVIYAQKSGINAKTGDVIMSLDNGSDSSYKSGIYIFGDNSVFIPAESGTMSGYYNAVPFRVGSGSNWTWRKYSDGTFDAWYSNDSVSTTASTSVSNGWYRNSSEYSMTLPSSVGAKSVLYSSVDCQNGLAMSFTSVTNSSRNSDGSWKLGWYVMTLTSYSTARVKPLKAYVHGTWS